MNRSHSSNFIKKNIIYKLVDHHKNSKGQNEFIVFSFIVLSTVSSFLFFQFNYPCKFYLILKKITSKHFTSYLQIAYDLHKI